MQSSHLAKRILVVCLSGFVALRAFEAAFGYQGYLLEYCTPRFHIPNKFSGASHNRLFFVTQNIWDCSFMLLLGLFVLYWSTTKRQKESFLTTCCAAALHLFSVSCILPITMMFFSESRRCTDSYPINQLAAWYSFISVLCFDVNLKIRSSGTRYAPLANILQWLIVSLSALGLSLLVAFGIGQTLFGIIYGVLEFLVWKVSVEPRVKRKFSARSPHSNGPSSGSESRKKLPEQTASLPKDTKQVLLEQKALLDQQVASLMTPQPTETPTPEPTAPVSEEVQLHKQDLNETIHQQIQFSQQVLEEQEKMVANLQQQIRVEQNNIYKVNGSIKMLGSSSLRISETTTLASRALQDIRANGTGIEKLNENTFFLLGNWLHARSCHPAFVGPMYPPQYYPTSTMFPPQSSSS